MRQRVPPHKEISKGRANCPGNPKQRLCIVRGLVANAATHRAEHHHVANSTNPTTRQQPTEGRSDRLERMLSPV